MKFIKKNKVPFIIALICFLLIILASFAIYRMFYPNGSKNLYGDRLENAPEVDNAVIEQIKNNISNTGLVEEVNYRTNVRIMKFFITVKDTAKMEDAKKIGDEILNKLSEKVKTFYDIEIYLAKSSASGDFPAIGYHSKNEKVFNWVLNKEVTTNEE